MKTRRPFLFAGLVVTVVIAAVIGYLSLARQRVPPSTNVEGLSPAEAEIVYASTCRVLSASSRQAIVKGEFQEGWFRLCDRYFADCKSLKKNSDGSTRVMLTSRWPGRAGMRMTMGFPAGWPERK